MFGVAGFQHTVRAENATISETVTIPSLTAGTILNADANGVPIIPGGNTIHRQRVTGDVTYLIAYTPPRYSAGLTPSHFVNGMPTKFTYNGSYTITYYGSPE